ncbi:PepSY-associated TM helix domain-containing protein [Algoriphagus sediminis]|uniref:PepSY-associated TM helix domain-containing protein n=1 Tax=Algoriphagus sediminis TaxID=3057113 RepID=A0ABT7Y8C9_9BACT|nr:PepSY-associated TM helix domain-containing protein [Algoriphagus sediminis]MDN3202777.1 PepSY-associated TM helix domain-containing protein [Algoriphagus sediminis]
MSSKNSLWKSIRNVFNQIHLYAGLICGIIVIAVCLSGTIYVYNTEIKETFDSELYFVEAHGKKLSPDEIRATLEVNLGKEVTQVLWTSAENRSVQFTLKGADEEGRGTTYYIDPYTSEILGDNSERTVTQEFMSSMFSLHRWLLLDRIEEPIFESMSNRELGRFINGIATSLFLLGVLTGIVIWFPNKVKNWRQGLKIKWTGNWKRINHDLHNTLAFYSLALLFIMSATGLFWSFQWYREGWQKTWNTYQTQEEREAEKNKPKPVFTAAQTHSLDHILAASSEAVGYKGNTNIYINKDVAEPISVRKYKTGFFAPAGSDNLVLSPEDLSVVEANLFSDLPTRQRIGRSVKYLHTGEIFGQATKFIWFIACLIATSLPISGTLIWWNKRSKKSKRHRTNPVKKKNRELEMA